MVPFLEKACEERNLPRPFECDFVVGGPPCQGVSGYNLCRYEYSPRCHVARPQCFLR